MSAPAPAFRRVVDLSHPVDHDTPVYPGDPEPSFTPATTIAEHGYNVLHVEMGSQTGTHLDAPYHFLEDGDRVEQLDPALLCAPAVIVDVRGKKPRSPIGWEDLAPRADELGPGVILVLHNGWSAHWAARASWRAASSCSSSREALIVASSSAGERSSVTPRASAASWSIM